MPRHAVPALAVVPFAVILLAGCGKEGPEQASQVPPGVTKQYAVLAAELAEKGKTVKAGPWTVNLITEAAEPWHEVHGHGHTTFRDVRPGETDHIEIIPVDTASGRIIPEVPIELEVVDAAGTVVAKEKLNFYGSTFFHYANNFSIAEPGTYTLKVSLDPPSFPWHGAEQEPPALAKGAVVEFTDVELGAR